MKQNKDKVKTRIAVYKVKTKRKDLETVKTTIAKHKVKTVTRKLKNKITKREDLKSGNFPAQNYLIHTPLALAVAFIPTFVFRICYRSFQLLFHSIFHHLIPFRYSLQKLQLYCKTSTANEATTQHLEFAIFTQPLILITRLLLTQAMELISFLLSRIIPRKGRFEISGNHHSWSLITPT